MRCSAAVLFFLSACSFSGNPGSGDGVDGPQNPDGPPTDGKPDGPKPDGPKPCVAGFVDLCTATVRPEALAITADTKINTGTDNRCVVRNQGAGNPELCILYFTGVSIADGATLTVHGSRALVLASSTTMTIEGQLDAASRRARLAEPGPGAGTCLFGNTPENDIGGGGGGTGGTFATQGGAGGVGDLNSNLGGDGTAPGGTPSNAVASAPSVLRGGCVGQRGGSSGGGGGNNGGLGGPGGGAVYLFAKGAIAISGRIFATGAGGGSGTGTRSGPGGGGSGGYLVIESDTQTEISGLLLATGGGGGEGGDVNEDGASGGESMTTAAAPGSTTINEGGDGGAGATYLNNALVPAGPGINSDGGGGGGGGGNGFIVIRGADRQLSGMSAPLHSMP